MTSRRRRPNLPALVVLTVVWVLLWDHVSLFLVLTGLLLAVLIGWVFPLPPIELHGKIRFVWLVRLVYRLLADVVRSSLAVLALVFRPGSTPQSSIIRVQLRSRSDLYLTQTAELVSLTPGTIVVETHRATSTLYLHVLATVDEGELARAAQAVLDAEGRVLRAFGSAAEVEALDRGLPQPTALPEATELSDVARHSEERL
jgi:multicomponent Na+:H+ antiporter subunit E